MANGNSKIIENVKVVMLKGEKGDAGGQNYTVLDNKPKINGVTLDGYKSSEALKLAPLSRFEVVSERMDNLVDSMGQEIRNLWTGSFDTIGGHITLSEPVSNFDYLDFYNNMGSYVRVPVSAGNVTVTTVNLSDNGSVAFQQTGEAVLTFSGTTVTLTKAYTWLWNPPENPSITSDILGVIKRIDGVANGVSESAEVLDIRVGADGVTYPSAGDAVRGQVGDLKSIIDAITPNDVSLSWTLGQYIDNNGTKATNRYVAMTNIVPVTAGDVIVSNTPKRDASNKLLLLYGNTYKNGVWQERVTMFDNSNTYKVEGDVDGIVIIFGRTSSSNVDISNQDIETYFDIQFYAPIVDDTLSVTGKASESVTTKNLILKNVPVRTASFCSWEYGKTIYDSGEIASYARSALSEMISIHGGIIRNLSPNEYDSENELIIWVIFYTNGQFVKRIGLKYDDSLIVPQDIDSIRFVFTFKSNSTIGNMRFDTLTKFFRVQIQENVSVGDGQRPTYVAIGASTTVGAIHHYDGMPVTFTPYAYPNYIGEIMSLNTYNLGEGSTGFMARNSGRQPNFMDVLYNNDSIFKEADLITLMFGYGNDRTAGLPVGQWDDYYPYDQEGYFYVEGDTANNDAGMQAMLANGATLMGCLNWMIKWIGEKYPQALLLCISSAPSGNSGNTAIVSGNKIVVTNNGSALSAPLQTLKEHLNIPIIDLFVEGLPFSYYASKATNDDGTYSIFSTKGTAEDKVWNSHPNDVGYLIYARFLAGVISRYFRH